MGKILGKINMGGRRLRGSKKLREVVRNWREL